MKYGINLYLWADDMHEGLLPVLRARGLLVVPTRHVERGGELPQRMLSRTQQSRGPPVAPGQQAGLERREEASCEDGRLSAARGPNDRQKAFRRQLVNDPVDLALSAKKEVCLFFAERS